MADKSLQRRHLEAIVAIAQHRSVHGAARQLGMAQPALSRLLGDAEAVLGIRLFARSSLGSQPTAAGEELLTQARFVLRGFERLGALAVRGQSQVRLGCIARGMHTLMPILLERIYPAHSGQGERRSETLRFRLVEGSTTALLEAAAHGGLDFAVVRSSGEDLPEVDLAVERLYDERTVIIAATDATLPAEPVALARLAEHDWVLPDLQTGSRASFDRFWHEQGLAPVRPLVETRSFETNLALVAHTRFLSIAPESIVARHTERGDVRVVRTRRALPRSPVILAYRRGAIDDPTLAAFHMAIHDAAAQARATLRGQLTSGRLQSVLRRGLIVETGETISRHRGREGASSPLIPIHRRGNLCFHGELLRVRADACTGFRRDRQRGPVRWRRGGSRSETRVRTGCQSAAARAASPSAGAACRPAARDRAPSYDPLADPARAGRPMGTTAPDTRADGSRK